MFASRRFLAAAAVPRAAACICFRHLKVFIPLLSRISIGLRQIYKAAETGNKPDKPLLLRGARS